LVAGDARLHLERLASLDGGFHIKLLGLSGERAEEGEKGKVK
jgi:hypothetical protein